MLLMKTNADWKVNAVTDCCGGDENTTLEYNPLNGQCEEPCPCPGCCDYNCCDELDYFLHKAYEQMYHEQYTSFDSFYQDWYNDFYNWWYTGDVKKTL